jgi:hypothetical protein
MVIEAPPGVLGPVDDAYFRWVTDVGLTGPDKGKGGKYLFVPPGYAGQLQSEGYFIIKPATYSNLIFYRSFVQAGDVAAVANGVKAKARIYPLAAASNPPTQAFADLSGKQFNTIHANTFHFYEEINAVVQHEPQYAPALRPLRPELPVHRRANPRAQGPLRGGADRVGVPQRELRSARPPL